jgi:hypothetical protein
MMDGTEVGLLAGSWRSLMASLFAGGKPEPVESSEWERFSRLPEIRGRSRIGVRRAGEEDAARVHRADAGRSFLADGAARQLRFGLSSSGHCSPGIPLPTRLRDCREAPVKSRRGTGIPLTERGRTTARVPRVCQDTAPAALPLSPASGGSALFRRGFARERAWGIKVGAVGYPDPQPTDQLAAQPPSDSGDSSARKRQ